VANITVNLNPPATNVVTVVYATGNGGAVAPNDYGPTGGTLTFAVGQVSQSFTVPLVDDGLDEADETVILSLSGPINARLGPPNPASLVIVDNDPIPSVQFSAASYATLEGGGPTAITATLSSLSGFPLSVVYATGNGTATAGNDYTAASGSLTFAPGQSQQTFFISPLDDLIDEADETVILTLSNPSGTNPPSLGLPNPAVLTISDDEISPTVEFSSPTFDIAENSPSGTALITTTLTPASGLPVQVDYASQAGSASPGLDYQTTAGTLSFGPGQTVLSFTVPITNDNFNEGNETVTLTLANPNNGLIGAINPATLTIIEDDIPVLQFAPAGYTLPESAGTHPITVTMNMTSSQTITAAYASSNLTALAGSDYLAASGSLSFAPGQSSASFPLTIIDDQVTNEFTETLSLTLSNAPQAIIAAPNPITVNVVDNDGQPKVGFIAATFSESEGGVIVNGLVTSTVVVSLSRPSALTVTVNYGVTGGTATAGSDYLAPIAGTLTFPPGSTAQSFKVVVINDPLDEALRETIILTLSSPVRATLDTNPATFFIIDDDPLVVCGPDPDATETMPDIGPPDAKFVAIDCDQELIVDVSALPIRSDGTPAYDMVYYERGQPNPPTDTQNIFLDWVIVQVGQSPTGPWYTVYYWGDGVRDLNSNVGVSTYGNLPETDSKNIPSLLPDMPLYQSQLPLTLITGIAIDIDARAPPGTYTYVRFYAPNDNQTLDPVQVDAIHPLPYP
jgi:hypothetical protein